MKVRKKPIVVDAHQFTSAHAATPGVCFGLFSDCGTASERLAIGYEPHVHTLEGVLKVQVGDWVIHGTRGEHWPVRDDIFRETYEIVDDTTAVVDSIRDSLVGPNRGR